ncbi:hypothetical protein FI667_g620, partial [Globisporangium splendens]
MLVPNTRSGDTPATEGKVFSFATSFELAARTVTWLVVQKDSDSESESWPASLSASRTSFWLLFARACKVSLSFVSRFANFSFAIAPIGELVLSRKVTVTFEVGKVVETSLALQQKPRRGEQLGEH